MITIYGMPTCPYCDYVHEQIRGREDEFNYINKTAESVVEAACKGYKAVAKGMRGVDKMLEISSDDTELRAMILSSKLPDLRANGAIGDLEL